jgi:predicted small lipoprotein YifL
MKSNFKPLFMKNTFKFMFVAAIMSFVLASCGAKTEKAADAIDSTATEVQAVVDSAAQVLAPADSLLK